MIEEMLHVFDQVQRDPDISVMILTGAWPAFLEKRQPTYSGKQDTLQ